MHNVRALVRSSLVVVMAVSCASASPPSPVQGPTEVVELPSLPAQPSAAASTTARAETATTLTAQSVEDFLRVRFAPLVDSGTLELSYPMEDSAAELIEELSCVHINTLADLAALVPPDFERRGVPVLAELKAPAANTLSLLRDLMVIKDARHYFRNCWRSHFSAGANEFPLPNAYGVSQQLLAELLAAGDTPVRR